MGIGVLALVPEATLVKMVAAPGPTVAAWRMGLTGGSLAIVLLARYGRGLPQVVRRSLGPWGLAVTVLSGCSNLLFILAVRATAVANVLLILATSSFWAALLCKVLLGAHVPKRTWVAMPVVFSGVGVTVSGGLNSGLLSLGDALALVMAILGATRRTIMRAHAGIDMLPAAMIGNLSFAAGLVLQGADLTMRAEDRVPILVLGLVLLPTSLTLTTAGSSLLPSAESSLILCTETVLSPVMAAAVIGEPVTARAWVGLLLVVSALVCHALWPLLSGPELDQG